MTSQLLYGHSRAGGVGLAISARVDFGLASPHLDKNADKIHDRRFGQTYAI